MLRYNFLTNIFEGRIPGKKSRISLFHSIINTMHIESYGVIKNALMDRRLG